MKTTVAPMMWRNLFAIAIAAIFTGRSEFIAAQTPTLIRDRVEPNWLAGGEKFWFQSRLANRGSEYILVDATTATREPLFDHDAVAKAIAAETGREVRADRLPVTISAVDLSSGTITFSVRNRILTFDRNGGETSWSGENETGDGEDSPADVVLVLPPIRSEDGGEPFEFRMVNRLEQTVEVLWVQTSRQPLHYATVPPGEAFTQSSYLGHSWLLRDDKGTDLGCFQLGESTPDAFDLTAEMIASVRQAESPPRRQRRRRTAQNREPGIRGGATSPDGTCKLEVREHNLWMLSSGGEPIQLTTDANESFSMRRSAQRARLVGMRADAADFPESEPAIQWAPEGKYFIAWQTSVVPERQVTIVRSRTPGEQPDLMSYPYAKPGDALPQSRPRLFETASGREILLDQDLFSDAWEVQLVRFDAAGEHVWIRKDQRGHQRIELFRVELSSGKTARVIEEVSTTFLHYSDPVKYRLWWLGDREALWSSERSGWNHLYRIDMSTGEVLNAVTSGEWNVRAVESVQNDQVVMLASGLVEGQEPYYEHVCRVRTDGTGFIRLTDGEGMHAAEWSPDGKFLIDRYSRVDLPPVWELRRGDSGELVCEIERAEFAASRDGNPVPENRGWLPERFVSPGRDGKTLIYGVVHWPAGFDKEQKEKYPLIEAIYAGPHDYHVPKSFQARRAFADFTNSGFVVVQIDGMGTAGRSKAFHDVCYRNLRDAGFPDRVAWIRALAEKYPAIDLQRVGIFGGSAGGQNAMAALLWHNDFYRVAVADCGCHDNRMDKIWWNEQWMGTVEPGNHYAENSNTENAGLLQGNLLLVVGEEDRNVDPATTMQVAANLIKAGKDFELLVIPGAGHGACETPYGRKKRLEFFKQHLAASMEPAAPDTTGR